MFRSTLVLSLLAVGSSFAPSVSRFASRAVATMAAKDGDVIPNVIFKCRVRDEKIGGSNPFTWKDVSTADLFKGKRVALFSLPGGMFNFVSSTPKVENH